MCELDVCVPKAVFKLFIGVCLFILFVFSRKSKSYLVKKKSESLLEPFKKKKSFSNESLMNASSLQLSCC